MEQFEIEITVKSKVKKQFSLPFFCQIGPHLYGLFENLICEGIYLSDNYFAHSFELKNFVKDFEYDFKDISQRIRIFDDAELKILSSVEYFELREEILQKGKDFMFNKFQKK